MAIKKPTKITKESFKDSADDSNEDLTTQSLIEPQEEVHSRRVFVSYSRKNQDTVAQLIEDIQAAGINTWYDQTLTGGQKWWDNILANIRKCDIFLFALSLESWESEACRSELDYVALLGKPILPVLVSDGININLLSPPLNEIQVIDYQKCDKRAAFALVKSINTVPSASQLPDPLPPPPRVPVSYLSTLKDRVDSTEPLSSQDQITLLFELENELRGGRSPKEIRDLLLRLKRRDELLAKIAIKIDSALKSLDDTSFAQPRKKTVSGSIESHIEAGDSKFQPPVTNLSPEDEGSKIKRSKTHRYICMPDEATRVITDVKGWLISQGFDSQQIKTDRQGVLLQIKKRGGWRDFVGMSTSLNIVFDQSADTLTVEIGAGKWIDKAAIGAVSMLILWPLAITAGFGAWEQMKMPEKIFNYIGTRLAYK